MYLANFRDLLSGSYSLTSSAWIESSFVLLNAELLVFFFRQLQRHFMADLSGMSQNLVFIELHPAIQTKTVLRTELRIFQEIQGILPEMSFSGDVLPD